MDAARPELPEAFLERLAEIVPPAHLAAVLASFSGSRAITFRVNTLKAEASRVRARLEAAGFEFRPLPFSADAFQLVSGSLRELQETGLYLRGELWVQGSSSMLAPLFLEPRAGERVLDLCAAPGSKTTQLACLMGDRGSILANDASRQRVYKLRRVLEDQGVCSVQVAVRRGEAYGRLRPGEFDRVLVDAPCSSEGRFRVEDPKSYSDWKPAKIKRLAAEQRRLVISGLYALRPGGVLVYSTCTFAPEENERVLGKVLRHFGGGVSLEPPPFEPPGALPGLSAWRGRTLDPSLALARRILPGEGREGFFLARLRRLEGPAKESTSVSDRSR